MKRILSLMILLLLLVPCVVNAAACDPAKVYIDSIEPESNSNVVEIEESSAKDKTIDLNLEMFNQGDNIKYKIVLKNDSEDDFIFDKNSLNIGSKYIEYRIESTDTSNILKAKSSKTMYLVVNYKNQIPTSEFNNGTYEDNVNMKVNLSYDDILNPNTGINYILIISLVLLMSIIFIAIKKKNYSKVLIIVGILLIPFSVNALCRCMININAKVKINILDDNFCIYDFTDTDYEFEHAKKANIPIMKNMTWNDFFEYAKSGKDNRFKFEVESACSNDHSECYYRGEPGFDEHVNLDNYNKFYVLYYENTPIEGYGSDSGWEGIDMYFINDDFYNPFGFRVDNNLNNKIDNTSSGVCYCIACG